VMAPKTGSGSARGNRGSNSAPAGTNRGMSINGGAATGAESTAGARVTGTTTRGRTALDADSGAGGTAGARGMVKRHSSIEGSEKLLGGRIVVDSDAAEVDEDAAGNSTSSIWLAKNPERIPKIELHCGKKKKNLLSQ
jgi:hypothetical protein